MAKMTLDQLRKLRESKQDDIKRRATEGKEGQIIIGMGTCGIAAGAKVVLDEFLDQFEKRGITNISVTQTGCMGLCSVEPTLEVIMPNMPNIIYGNVDKATVEKIVEDHIINKKLVNDHVIDRPASDIVGDK
ncbi:MAG: (2Fe-2S) ferredoxin domain-containing protein [Sphaerochaeta sp.]|jgi:NADP-reducing hydrogenase subunit HndB